jgi:nucleoside-diphosphate-sugar epimerase
MHHTIDRWIMDAATDTVKPAIICPPDIYGQSSTIGSRSTFLVPEYVNVILKSKEPFYLGAGENIRAVTHIDDVVAAFMLLIKEALKGGGNAQWGTDVRKI